jgi:hypothetical protein
MSFETSKDDAFKIILINENIKETIIVCPKKHEANSKRPFTRSIELFDTKLSNFYLDSLNLVRVPLVDLIPPATRFKKDHETEECPICRCEYKHKEHRRDLNCGHYFHKKCVDKWLKKCPNCPVCRQDII